MKWRADNTLACESRSFHPSTIPPMDSFLAMPIDLVFFVPEKSYFWLFNLVLRKRLEFSGSGTIVIGLVKTTAISFSIILFFV